MKTIRPAPSRHQAPGKFIDNDDFTSLDQVFLVAVEEVLSSQRLLQVTHQTSLLWGDIFWPLRIAQRHVEQTLDVGFTNFCQGDIAIALIELKVFGF